MMHNIRWTNIKLIFQREVRDQLRDRRTMFMIAILPLMLYPLMGMSFMQVTQFLKKHPSNILLVTEAPLPEGLPRLDEHNLLESNPSGQSLMNWQIRTEELPSFEKSRRQSELLIDQGSYDLVICFPAAFIRRIDPSSERNEVGREVTGATFVAISRPTSRQEQDAAGMAEDDQPMIFCNLAKDRSRVAYERTLQILHRWRAAIARQKLSEREATLRADEPFVLAPLDLAKPAGRRAAVWSKILPFVALIWALTGAFYPAVDLCAGEKERGTLETLLSSPAGRSEIVLGKLATIMLFSFATSVLNLSCMVFTATFAMHQFRGLMPVDTMGPPPLHAVGWLILLLLPIVALFSALALALATMARSTREGQYYLMPLLLITMPLILLAMFPSAELDLGSSLIPVTGMMLLLRQLMEGEYQSALVYLVPVMLVTLGCGVMAIRWAIDQFNDESVLFRESERFSLALWLRHLVRDRSPTPSAAEAIVCGILILVVRFYAGLSIPMPTSWNGFAILTVITLVAFVATPALVMAIMLTTSPRDSLLLRRPPQGISIFMAAGFAICLHPIAIALSVMIRVLYPIDPALLAPFENLFVHAPNFAIILLLMAVLPAICEEVAFRGFILSGLRHLGYRWRAIVISSLFFGVAHGVVQQSLLAVIFGMVLGFIAVQSRSIFPCIAFHAVHNGLALSFNQFVPAFVERHPQLDWLFHNVQDGVGGSAYFYGPPLILAGFILSAGIIRWFCGLPCHPTDEERIQDAIEHQHVRTVPI